MSIVGHSKDNKIMDWNFIHQTCEYVGHFIDEEISYKKRQLIYREISCINHIVKIMYNTQEREIKLSIFFSMKFPVHEKFCL